MSKNDEKKVQSLRTHAFGMVTLLMAEFIFGIYTTLYVHFPEKASTRELWMFSSKQIILNIHMTLGILIAIGALEFLIRAIIAKQSLWIISTILGLVGIVIAVFGGLIFIPTQSDSYSFIMSIGFSLSIAAYGWGLFANKSHIK